MKTKFTPIVKFKKSELDKVEERVQNLLRTVHKETENLKNAYAILMQITQPTSGSINEYLSNKLLQQRQREIIIETAQTLEDAKEKLSFAKEQQKLAYIEFEKYKYLESEEVKKMIKEIRIKEAKDLDEVALQGFMNKRLSQ